MLLYISVNREYIMGVLLSKCRLCGNGESITDLSDVINTLRQQLLGTTKKNKELYECNQELSSKNKELNEINEELNNENKKIVREIIHIKNILNNSESIAETILESELKCQWMDYAKERVYLMSIIDFLNVVCSDIMYVLHTVTNENEDVKNPLINSFMN